jgi:uncharacterized GH25 family protein
MGLNNRIMMKTHVDASPEQIEAITKRIKQSKLYNLRYAYDSEDEIGFVSFELSNGVKVDYQFRNERPCFVGYHTESIVYDFSYPEGELYDILKGIGIKAAENFRKGGEI